MAERSIQVPAASAWPQRLPLILAGTYALIAALYILLSDTLVLLIVDDPDRITLAQTIKGWGFVLLTSVLLFAVAHYGFNRVRESERAERRSNDRFRQMIHTTNEGVWLLDEAGRTMFVNERLSEMLGYTPEEMHGRPLVEFAAPEFRRTIDKQFAERRAGKRSQYECRFLSKSGRPLWVIVSGSPLFSSDGAFEGVLQMVTDITHRKAAEEALEGSIDGQRELLNELDHRVRNNLSSVLGLIQMARGAARDVDSMADSITGRVKAMSSAYSLLSTSGWSEQDLARFIGAIVPGGVRDRVTLDGPPVAISSRQIGAMALLVNELLSNAMRYGALSVPSGSVCVKWNANDSPDASRRRLTVEWIERGGPPIEGAATPGAGCRLIEGLCRSDLRGSAMLNFSKDGVHHVFQIDLFRPAKAARA